MLDYRICELNPWCYHLSNVILHAATAILLLLVLWRMTGEFWPSALGGGRFALHPLRAESVAWVSERKDVLSGLFFVLTLGAYVGYVHRPFSWLRYLLVVLLFVLGLMAKPMLVTLPLVCCSWTIGRSGAWRSGGGWSWRSCRSWLFRPLRAWPRRLPSAKPSRPLEFIPFTERLANASVAYAAYVKQLFYPVGLAVLYPHQGDRLPVWQIAGSMLVLACISLAVLTWRRKCPYLLIGWLWYLGMLVPVIGFVQVGVQSMADRYTYLPQIGLVIAVAWGASQVSRSWPHRTWLLAAASALLVAALMGRAWQQTSYWCNGECSGATPSIARCPTRLPRTTWAGSWPVADASTRPWAITKKPGHQARLCEVYNNFGALLGKDGRFDEAIADFNKALELKPDYPDARDNLEVMQSERANSSPDWPSGANCLRSRPDDVKLINSIAWVLATVPNESIRDGPAAVELARRAEKLTGGSEPIVLDTLAAAYAASGRFAEAVQTARKAVDLAGQQDKQPMVESIKARLRLYEAGKPFRETKRRVAGYIHA